MSGIISSVEFGRFSPTAILFDLDGTLADTAADLCGAANRMRAQAGLSALPLAQFRPWVSRGGRAMLEIAFAEASVEQREAMLPTFLALYAEHVADETELFPGVADLLSRLEAAAISWGIVTNKPIGLAEPVVKGLRLDGRSSALIGGDSLAERKPHPLPLFEACRRMGVAPARALYVGDDRRDVEAGHAAGMPVVAVSWGYLPPNDPIACWGADVIIDQPGQLLELIGLASAPPAITAQPATVDCLDK